MAAYSRNTEHTEETRSTQRVLFTEQAIALFSVCSVPPLRSLCCAVLYYFKNRHLTMINVTYPDPWLKCPRPSPNARLRLFCFPYAGGGASVFRAWPQLMPPEVEVRILQLPGRESRMGEEPFRCFTPMIHAVAQTMAQFTDLPFAFYGHSMGALIAFEAARLLRTWRGVEPLHLFVSGCPAPQSIPVGRGRCAQSDTQFIEELRQLNGTPAALLENQELMQLFLPLLRADFALCDSYRYVDGQPLSCPITAFGGRRDPQVSTAQLTEWRHQTKRPLRQGMFAGDHFFLHDALKPLIQMVGGLLRRHASPRDPSPLQPAWPLLQDAARYFTTAAAERYQPAVGLAG